MPKPKFSLGQVVGTPAALKAINDAGQSPMDFLSRHLVGDWGCLDAEDRDLNDKSVITGSRILSAYKTLRGTKLWIITEATDDDGNRSATTILLPEQY